MSTHKHPHLASSSFPLLRSRVVPHQSYSVPLPRPLRGRQRFTCRRDPMSYDMESDQSCRYSRFSPLEGCSDSRACTSRPHCTRSANNSIPQTQVTSFLHNKSIPHLLQSRPSWAFCEWYSQPIACTAINRPNHS